ncbi:MAG TPA: glycerophosphodiester phosphodiesterase [Actinospica sp.]|nr:glycerophosphodiester phosphodiesterase [Actinospica sp.]
MVLAVAHRGAPHAHRENTIPALLSAVHLGAGMVEVDLERTRDGVLILLHDADLNRLWEHEAKVADLSLADLRALTSDGAYTVPTLTEALALFSATGIGYMLDMTEPEFAVQSVAEVQAVPGALERMLFVGGASAMRAVRERSEEARIGLTLDRPWPGHAPDEPIESIRPQYLNPDCRLLDQDVVAAMHDAGYLVSTWTVDSPTHMAHLLDAGVDALITNRIDRLVRLIAARTETEVHAA